MKMYIIIISIIITLTLGWFIGINSIYTDTYSYPPLGKPFIQQGDGSYISCIERTETKTHIGVPFTQHRNNTYFMMFTTFPDNLPNGKYVFPGGTYIVHDTILSDNSNRDK